MRRVYGTPGTSNDGKSRSSDMAGDDLAVRAQWVINEFEARGKRFRVNEIYRPLGVPADRYVTKESQTSTGTSNEWFQKGREDRGETPSAATPGQSDHGRTGYGEGAIDCDVDDQALRSSLMGVVGLFRTVPSESWHFATRREPEAWWDRNKVTFPGEAVTPTKPASDTSKRKKESIMPLIYQENDTKDGKTFIMDGGAVWINPDELKSAIALNVAAGLTGPGFSEPAPVSWVHITRVSDALRRATQVKEVRDDIKNISKS